jgi:hypothetical protein
MLIVIKKHPLRKYVAIARISYYAMVVLRKACWNPHQIRNVYGIATYLYTIRYGALHKIASDLQTYKKENIEKEIKASISDYISLYKKRNNEKIAYTNGLIIEVSGFVAGYIFHEIIGHLLEEDFYKLPNVWIRYNYRDTIPKWLTITHDSGPCPEILGLGKYDDNGALFIDNILIEEGKVKNTIDSTKLDAMYELLGNIYFNGINMPSALSDNKIKIENDGVFYNECYKIISILQHINSKIRLNFICNRISSDYYIKSYEYQKVITKYVSISYTAIKDQMPLVYERSIVFGDDYTCVAENINKEINILNQQDSSLNIYNPKGNCLMENRVVHFFIRLIANALTSYQIKDNISFLSKYKKDGEYVFDKKMSLIDDPFLKNGLNIHLYDYEGVPCKKKTLIMNGKIHDYLSDKHDSNALDCTGGNAFSSPPEFQKIITFTNLMLNISKEFDEKYAIDFIFDYIDMSFYFNILTGDMNGIIWGRKLSGKNTGYCRININDNIINFFNNIKSHNEMRYYSGYYFPLIMKSF